MNNVTFAEWEAYYDSFTLADWVQYCVTRRRARRRSSWTQDECEQYYLEHGVPTAHEWALSLFAWNFPEQDEQAAELAPANSAASSSSGPQVAIHPLPYHGLLVMNATFSEWEEHYNNLTPTDWAQYCVSRRGSRGSLSWTQSECEAHSQEHGAPTGHEWALSLFEWNHPQVTQQHTLDTPATSSSSSSSEVYGPHQLVQGGWILSEWALFYASFTVGSWAAFASMAWARWACGLS